jgi:hypothetical protein
MLLDIALIFVVVDLSGFSPALQPSSDRPNRLKIRRRRAIHRRDVEREASRFSGRRSGVLV